MIQKTVNNDYKDPKRNGSISTVLALSSLLVLLIGIFAGRQIVEIGTRFLPRAALPYLPSANLVGYWTMDEASGSTVGFTTTGVNGTASGDSINTVGTGIVDGKYGKARKFNGNNDKIS